MVSRLFRTLSESEYEVMNKDLMRYDLLQILEANFPLNTAQICRLIKGRDKNDIKYCRSTPEKDWGSSRLRKYGSWGYYDMCRFCIPNVKEVYTELRKLEFKGFLESRLETRQDPLRFGQKDRMRMWAHKGKLPSLIPFLDFSEIATKEEH